MNKIYYDSNVERFKHNTSFHRWKYPSILSISSFLKDFENYLTDENISEAIHKLNKYNKHSEQGALTLHFQKITLEVMSADESFKTMGALESLANKENERR